MIKFNKERDLATILNRAYEHDGQGYVDYIKEVIELPSNKLLVEYSQGQLRGWCGEHLSESGQYKHLYATSIDNTHTIDMWRSIRRIIKGRKMPVISGITANFEKVERMAALYGGVFVEEYKTLVFPVGGVL